MKNILNKILHPNKLIGIPSFILGFALLIYVFSFHLDYTFVAYIAYLWTTYDLIIFIIWFVKACQFSNNYIKENSKLYKLYDTHKKMVTKISLYCSLAINFIYGILKFGTGLYYKSFWFITFAIYYLTLWDMKWSLVKNVERDNFGANKIKEYKILKKTGIILLLLNFVLIGIIVLTLHQNKTFSYPGYLIYAIAIYDFGLIISAIVNMFKYKKYKSPIISASKCINLTVAMISMISLEVAMIYEFGNGDNSFRNTMISLTGFVVAGINTIMSIYMISKANKNLKLN